MLLIKKLNTQLIISKIITDSVKLRWKRLPKRLRPSGRRRWWLLKNFKKLRIEWMPKRDNSFIWNNDKLPWQKLKLMRSQRLRLNNKLKLLSRTLWNKNNNKNTNKWPRRDQTQQWTLKWKWKLLKKQSNKPSVYLKKLKKKHLNYHPNTQLTTLSHTNKNQLVLNLSKFQNMPSQLSLMNKYKKMLTNHGGKRWPIMQRNGPAMPVQKYMIGQIMLKKMKMSMMMNND